MWSEIKGNKREKKKKCTVDHAGSGQSVAQVTSVDPGLSGGCYRLTVALQEKKKNITNHFKTPNTETDPFSSKILVLKTGSFVM